MKLEVYYLRSGNELPEAYYPQPRSFWRKPMEATKSRGFRRARSMHKTDGRDL